VVQEFLRSTDRFEVDRDIENKLLLPGRLPAVHQGLTSPESPGQARTDVPAL
jgi:hypothetical protein